MTPAAKERLRRARPWAAPLALLLAWTVFALRNYEIRAFSDPMNWLYYARHLGDQIRASRWPLGFPVFLRGALDLAGPYAVFLVNLPVLIGVFLLSAGLAARAAADPRDRWAAFTLALALLLMFDSGLVLQLANPFRDPLSFLLALGAVHLLVRHAESGGGRARRPLLAGGLLGLACCVRETSILLLLPVGIYAVWSWRADRRIRFWRDAVLFGLALAAGLAPLFIQSYLSTGHALAPPQSAMQATLVPGMHYEGQSLRSTLGVARDYYRETAGAGLLLVPLGAALALGRRNRLAAGLLVPATLVFAVFYAFYWTFVRRYFYVAALFAIPLAAGGLADAARRVDRRWIRHARGIAPSILALAAAGTAFVRLLSAAPAAPHFQIPQARQFAADLAAQAPADSLVFCRRPLCEMVRWFTPLRAFPATALIADDAPAETALRAALEPYLRDARPMFLLEMQAGKSREPDAALLARFDALRETAAWPADRFHLRGLTGAETLRLFKIERPLPATPQPPDAETAAAQARRDYLDLDFSVDAELPWDTALLGDFTPPSLRRPYPRLAGSATLTLPGELRAGETGWLEVSLRSADRGTQPLAVELDGGGSCLRNTLARDRSSHAFGMRFDGPRPPIRLRISLAGPADLQQACWAIPQPTERLDVDVGSPGDFPHLRDGWFSRERPGAGRQARWTGPMATVGWRCSRPGSPARITVRHWARARPAGLPAPRLVCNDVELDVHPGPEDRDGASDLTADIPAGVLRADNLIRIECRGWHPATRDPRMLGLFVDRLILETAPPPPHP